MMLAEDAKLLVQRKDIVMAQQAAWDVCIDSPLPEIPMGLL